MRFQLFCRLHQLYFLRKLFFSHRIILLKFDKANQKLLAHSYPGNIRELKAMIELASVLADGEQIDSGDINFASSDPLADLTLEDKSLKEYNNVIIKHFLTKYDNNVVEAAKALDIGKSTIYRMLKEH